MVYRPARQRFLAWYGVRHRGATARRRRAAVESGGAMPIRYAELMGEITGLPPLPIAEMGPPTLTPLQKPLREARVMIVTSSGVHLAGDPPFNHPNDMTFRRIPHETPLERLHPSHPTPVRRPGEA